MIKYTYNTPIIKFHPLWGLNNYFSTSFNCLNKKDILLTLPGFTTYAIKTYLNPISQRNDILKDLKGKPGFTAG